MLSMSRLKQSSKEPFNVTGFIVKVENKRSHLGSFALIIVSSIVFLDLRR